MKNKKNNGLCILLFVGYIGILVYFLFFAELLGRNTVHSEYSYNLVLFKEIKRFIKYRRILGEAAVWLNLLGNVAAFIPFGVFVPVVIKRDAGLWQIVFITAVFSLIIECVQLILRVGSFDVDDILLNSIGGLVGAVIYFIYLKMSKANI